MTGKNDRFSIREKLALRILIIMFSIAKPFEYRHECVSAVKSLEDAINNNGESYV